MIYVLIFIGLLIPLFWHLYKYIEQQKENQADLKCISRTLINKFELDLLVNFEEYRFENLQLPLIKKFDFKFYIRNYEFYLSADFISFYNIEIFNIFLIADNTKHLITSPFLIKSIKSRINEYIENLNKEHYENVKKNINRS